MLFNIKNRPEAIQLYRYDLVWAIEPCVLDAVRFTRGFKSDLPGFKSDPGVFAHIAVEIENLEGEGVVFL